MKRKCWKFSAGSRGNTVTVREGSPGGVIYCWEPNPTYRGGYRRYSLQHRDRDAAETHALDRAKQLTAGAPIPGTPTTVAQLFARYQTTRTPNKRTAGERLADKRRIDMWSRFLGGATPAKSVTRADVDRFVRQRRDGEIDARAVRVKEELRRPVRARAVQGDCTWLRWTLAWGVDCGLVPRNPLAGVHVPKESNPRRPVASHDRYEALRAVSDRVTMRVRLGGKRREVRSYLSELLDLAEETGRRISPICQLRYENLRIERTATAPHGAIQWPGETDKQGREWSAPLSPLGRASVDRVLAERPGLGPAFLFPDPRKPDRPIHRRLATSWLYAAEDLAEVAHLRGGAWHPFRRKWATERKHLPHADVAAAGGWGAVETLQRCYQQADEGTTLEVVLSPARLRERKA